MRRHWCAVDTARGVQLIRQRSDSSCIFNRTWGYDRRGILGGSQLSAGGLQMVRQRSDSPCVYGRTWGYDRYGIWVDRGRRADFEVGSYR